MRTAAGRSSSSSTSRVMDGHHVGLVDLVVVVEVVRHRQREGLTARSAVVVEGPSSVGVHAARRRAGRRTRRAEHRARAVTRRSRTDGQRGCGQDQHAEEHEQDEQEPGDDRADGRGRPGPWPASRGLRRRRPWPRRRRWASQHPGSGATGRRSRRALRCRRWPGVRWWRTRPDDAGSARPGASRIRGVSQASEPTMVVMTASAQDTNQPSTPNQVAATRIAAPATRARPSPSRRWAGSRSRRTAADRPGSCPEDVGDARARSPRARGRWPRIDPSDRPGAGGSSSRRSRVRPWRRDAGGRRVGREALRAGRAGEDVREAMMRAYRSDPMRNGSHTRHVLAASPHPRRSPERVEWSGAAAKAAFGRST